MSHPMRDDLEATRDVLALEPGEVVLWESKPSLRWVALSNAWLLFIGAVFPSGPIAMALFARQIGSPWLVWICLGVVPFFVGSACHFARFAWLLHQARRTLYRITTRRLVCTTTALWRYEHHALAVSELGGWKIERGMRWGTRGTVTLRELSGGEYARWMTLIGIRDPEAALHALQLLQKGVLSPIR